MSHDDTCQVPVPHRHRKPTKAELVEARETLVLEHPPTCAWRRDTYDGCSCGVTRLVTELYTLGAVIREDD